MSLLHQLSVKLFVIGDHSVDFKVLRDAVAARLSESWPSGSVAAHAHDGGGQCVGIGGRDELSRYAVGDDFGVASHGGGHDGETDRHRFELVSEIPSVSDDETKKPA